MPPRGRVERTRAPPRRSAASRCPSPNTHALPPATARRVSRVRTRANRWETFLRARSSRRDVVSLPRASHSARAHSSRLPGGGARSARTTSSRGRATTRARRRTETNRFFVSRGARATTRARGRVALSRRSAMDEHSSRHPRRVSRSMRLALGAVRAVTDRAPGGRSRRERRRRAKAGIDPARVPVVSRPNTIIGNGGIMRR